MAFPCNVTRDAAEKLKEDGYAVIENFLSVDECEKLKKSMRELVDDMDPKEHNAVFTTESDEAQAKTRGDYFMTSGDKVRYFFETESFDDKGNLKYEKLRSLNKVGHALHVLVPEFKDVTFRQEIKDLFRTIGFRSPAVCQSMYIFKNPYIGASVTPHQDATFLYTEPELRVVGIWIALEDATPSNGCLRFIPGSHKNGIHNSRRMVRTDGGNTTRFTADQVEYKDEDFVAAPIKRGDLILIDGCVVHQSYKNTSDRSREIYTYHVIETDGITWSPQNWLQPSKEVPFTAMNEQ